MKIEKFIPSDTLKPFIKAYIIIESSEEKTNKILPGTSTVIAFRLKGITHNGNDQSILPGSAITGLTKSPRLINYSNATTTLLTLFKEAGAIAFFKNPQHELFEQHISLDNIFHSDIIRSVEDSLTETTTNTQRIAIIENFFLSNLRFTRTDPFIKAAVQKIKLSNGNIRIRDLATTLYISIDALEKKFRTVIGTSPKHFSSIIRVENVIKNYSKGHNLTDIAYESGFYDQSHFIREFKLFTGQSPGEFFKGYASRSNH